MYRTFHDYCLDTFGCKVYKLSLNGGFTCPNRDGTLDTRGCIFCSAYGGGEFAEGCGQDLATQLENARNRVRHKNKSGKYMAYFQAFTNTYAPVSYLRQCMRRLWLSRILWGLPSPQGRIAFRRMWYSCWGN